MVTFGGEKMALPVRRASFVGLLLVGALLSVGEVEAQELEYRFYNTTCPNVEKIIRTNAEALFNKDRTIAAGILRLLFHDCFVRVSNPFLGLHSRSKWYCHCSFKM